MRIVVDTNVIIEALIRPRSPSGGVYGAFLQQKLEFVYSDETAQELVTGIIHVAGKYHARGKAAPTKKWLQAAAAILARSGHVEPIDRFPISPDPSDDAFYDCAYASGVPYIVTNNLKDFPGHPPQPPVNLKAHKVIVLKPEELLQLLRPPRVNP